jgi:hypothetical protein
MYLDRPYALPPAGVAVPVFYDDDFDEKAGASLPKLSVASLNLVSIWSARNSMSGFVPATAIARYSDDPDGFTRTLVTAGIAQRRPRGAMQIIPGCGVTIVNANAAARPAGPLSVLALAPAPVPAAQPAQTPGARRTALCRVPELTREVRARDGDLCRYCGRQVQWGKGRARDSAVWDWVEPLGGTSPENVVTACKACGHAKAGRPPEEAGMVLLPVPRAEERNASRNASGEGMPGQKRYTPDRRNASCNASDGETPGQKRYTSDSRNASPSPAGASRNASGEGMPGQKRYTPSPEPRDENASDYQDLNQSSRGNSNGHLEAARPREGTDPAIITLAANLAAKKAGRAVSAAEARRAIAVWDKRAEDAGKVIHDPARFYRTCATRERDIEAILAPPPNPLWVDLGTPADPVPGAHAYEPHPSQFVDECTRAGCGLRKSNARHVSQEAKTG